MSTVLCLPVLSSQSLLIGRGKRVSCGATAHLPKA